MAKFDYQNSFKFIPENQTYLDAACQSLRPQPVIDALNDYYQNFNSCGERVKYQWGIKTDEKVSFARAQVLKFLKLKSREYFVSFTLNTTYGLNLLLQQFILGDINMVITSNIEHNSSFLSSLSFAKKHQIARKILARESDGSIHLSDLEPNSLIILNCAANFDGRRLLNIREVIKKAHQINSFVIIDAAQAIAHSSDILHKTDADAICFSAHKTYAPSLGVIVMKKSFASRFESSFIGGGMVDDVNRDSYLLSSDNPDHLHTKFEPGLQAWGEIIALGTALDWLNNLPKFAHQNLDINTKRLYEFLSSHPKVHLINHQPNPTMSFYVDGIDSHLLGAALADQGIMARTGYFCVHYYLDHVMKYPPLIRFSLGLHTRSSDIDRVISALSNIK